MDDGSIEVIKGPMFSRKTTTLIKKIREGRQTYGQSNVLVIKHSLDTRYDLEKIVSHDNATEKAIAVSDLSVVHGIVNYFDKIKMVLIDEGQFYDSNELRKLCEFLRDAGKHVVVAGLDKNYKRENFPTIENISLIANIEHTLSAKCTKCNNKAPYTAKRKEKTTELNANLNSDIVIGGAELYFPLCNTCFEKYSDEICN